MTYIIEQIPFTTLQPFVRLGQKIASGRVMGTAVGQTHRASEERRQFFCGVFVSVQVLRVTIQLDQLVQHVHIRFWSVGHHQTAGDGG